MNSLTAHEFFAATINTPTIGAGVGTAFLVGVILGMLLVMRMRK